MPPHLLKKVSCKKLCCFGWPQSHSSFGCWYYDYVKMLAASSSTGCLLSNSTGVLPTG